MLEENSKNENNKKIKDSTILPLIISIFLTISFVINTVFVDGKILFLFLIPAVAVIMFGVVWSFLNAGFNVLKTFFLLSAELSLMVFLADMYCKSSRGHDLSMVLLLNMSLLYVAYEFISTVKDAVFEKWKSMPAQKKKWARFLAFVPYLLFTIIFTFVIYNVLCPIIMGLCIFK